MCVCVCVCLFCSADSSEPGPRTDLLYISGQRRGVAVETTGRCDRSPVVQLRLWMGVLFSGIFVCRSHGLSQGFILLSSAATRRSPQYISIASMGATPVRQRLGGQRRSLPLAAGSDSGQIRARSAIRDAVNRCAILERYKFTRWHTATRLCSALRCEICTSKIVGTQWIKQ